MTAQRRACGRAVRALAGAAAALVLTTGCNFTGISDVNLPGGPAAGAATYPVTAVFDDVLDLVPQSAVRVNDVAVGSVDKITLTKDFKARVQMRIKKSVQLPANSIATLQQTTLLGEKFIGIGPPDGQQPQGVLKHGAVLADNNTVGYPDVEELFAVLSGVLNGGGLANLQTINTELTKALQGREADVKDLLGQLNTFVGGLDAQKGEINRALTELDALSGKLAKQNDTIATALQDIGPGLKVIADNRTQLVTLLQHLSKLGEVGTRILDASREDTVANLKNLAPVLTKLAAAKQNLPKSLELLADYPFPKNATKAIPGDYTGLRVTLAADTFFRLVAPPTGPAPAPATPTAPNGGLGDLLNGLGGQLPSPGDITGNLPSLPGTNLGTSSGGSTGSGSSDGSGGVGGALNDLLQGGLR